MASYIYHEIDRGNFDGDRCYCDICLTHSEVNLPAPRNIDVEHLKPLANDFSRRIFDDWTGLNAILKRHELTIRKRWLKKGAAWRSNVLLTVQPDIPLHRRANFDGYRESHNRGLHRKRTCSADAHLVPYINKEDLIHDYHLLLFLNSRGRNLPVHFIATEAERAHLDIDWKEFYQPSNDVDSHIMLFTSKETSKGYGIVVEVSRVPPRLVQVKGLKPIFGLLLLEIQQKIYSFLLRCVQHILRDYSMEMLMQAPEHVEPAELECDLEPNIRNHTVEADYRRPLEAANLGRLQMLVSCQREVAEDHILLLREDPGYFIDNLRARREYYADPDAKNYSWQSAAQGMLSYAFDGLYTWTCLANHLADMRPLADQIASVNPGTCDLDAEDERKWAILVSNLHYMQQKAMQSIQWIIPRSSGLRNGLQTPHTQETCKFKPYCAGPRGCEGEWNLKRGASPAHHRVFFNFSMLAGVDPVRLSMHGLRAVVQETNYMLEHDDAASELVDPWILPSFFDLAVLSDLEYCIKMMRPYTNNLPMQNGTTPEALHNKEMTIRLMLGTANGALEVRGLGDPFDGRFHYPAEKRRTAENVKQMQRAEAALESYWTELAVCMDRYGIHLELMLSQQMRTYAPIARKTRDWDEELTAPMKNVQLGPSQDSDCNAQLETPKGKENMKTEINAEQKVKTKTRGSPQEETTGVHDPLAEADDPAEARQPIVVPRRIFKVMSALLPSPATISEASREISWKEFQFAFNAIGLIPEKLYGSVWIFKPLPEGEGLVNVKRSIQYHEPKSVRHGNKIDAQMVRRFGDRLKRVFGWDGETFVCA